MKRILKDKRGMSLMEILVALTLLMIIILGTAPIMLQAYDGLYKAGEYTQNTYDAKTEIEDQLATRNSELELQDFAINFNNLGEVAKINAKRAVSSIVNGLETVFTGGRAYITIISGNTVNDDATSHEFTVQISNYNLNSTDEICDISKYKEGKHRLAFDVKIPVKSLVNGTENLVYPEGEAAVNAYTTVVEEKTNVKLGRVTVKIEGNFDFTKSPLKIVVWYIDEDGNYQNTADYLHIKTPTIIAAGKTSAKADYYTTAGVVTTENKTTNKTTTTFDIEGRMLSTNTYKSTQTVPENTIFKAVNWITETIPAEERSTTSAQASNPFETSYYVLTGTNGAIYRTYSQAKVGSIGGRVSIAAACGDSDFGINGLKLNNYTGMNQLDASTDAIDVMGVNEASFNIDKTGETIFPAGWSGDFSHIFGWSAYGEESGYIQRTNQDNTNGTWYTQNSSDVTTSASNNGEDGVRGIGSDGYFSNLACYGYYYNGYALNTKYYSMNSKKISYVLTEMPESMRIGGYMGDVGSADNYGYDGTTLDRIWEQPNYIGDDGNEYHQRELNGDKIKLPNGTETQLPSLNFGDGWYYTTSTSFVPRSAIIRAKKDKSHNDKTNKLPVYYVNDERNWLNQVRHNDYGGLRPDNGFAQLRLKALTTLSPTTVYSRGDHTDEPEHMRVAYDNNDNYSKITVTDAVYLPATDKTQAGMFYIGTVAAYGLVNQVDNMGMNDLSPDVSNMANSSTSNTGRLSSYWILSDDTGTSTTIYKRSENTDSINHDDLRKYLMVASERTSNYYGTTSADLKNPIKANSDDSHEFFITQPIVKNGDDFQEKISGRVFSDIAFTMGYTSNREMVYTNIVYGKDSSGKLIQALKFCEPLYFLSHYDNKNHNPNLWMNGTIDSTGETHTTTYNGVVQDTLNSPYNDYYNVWFPGEMYNLTKVATKDGVTVAVGYAVSGSAYTYLNTMQNASTGLGSIYNDGVLAGMVLGEEAEFTNLLYYKDNIGLRSNDVEGGFDDNSLSDGSVKFLQHGYDGEVGDKEKTYAEIFPGLTYGTHARNSVQFTAVDLSVENIQTTTSEDGNGNVTVTSHSESYYAYYSDNWGRVFRSLVATKDKNGKISRVSHIADQAYNSNRTAPSFMEEQKVGTESIGDYFEKITSIRATSDLIVVTGHPKAGSNFYIVVGEISDGSDAPTWKAIKIDGLTSTNKANDMLYLNNYLYIVGDKGSSTSGGWISATSISSIKDAVENSKATVTGTLKKDVNDALYAIDGHS